MNNREMDENTCCFKTNLVKVQLASLLLHQSFLQHYNHDYLQSMTKTFLLPGKEKFIASSSFLLNAYKIFALSKKTEDVHMHYC